MTNKEILKELCRLKNQVNELIRVVDNRFSGECAENADDIAAAQDALCDIDGNTAERFAAIEDALCEIDAGG